jgi:hypothetical protein
MNTTNKSSVINADENKVVLYTDKHGDVELRADTRNDTLWATQEQIARVFDTTIPNINIHLKNIYKDGELREKTTIKESLIVLKDGRQYLTKFYNLDAIIAVGYRVNSRRATRFRIWATRVLREYLINGFAIRQKKLAGPEQNFDNLQEALTFMESGSRGGPVKARLSLRLFKDVMK